MGASPVAEEGKDKVVVDSGEEHNGQHPGCHHAGVPEDLHKMSGEDHPPADWWISLGDLP